MTPAAPSRILSRLDGEIAAERDPLRVDCLRAERAAYLARQGQAPEAEAEVAALHQRHDAHPRIEISAWLSLAEGLLSFFSDMGPVAIDKMRRAHALSEAAGLTQMQALSAAWLAHLEYLRFNVPAMARHLGQSLRLALPENHGAQARASLVMAEAYHISERIDLALPWYSRAREHANADGDEQTISALMHNMAWIRAANIRKAALTGEGTHAEGAHALLAAESTWSFDKLIDATSLSSLVPLLHAQILAAEGQPSLALELYEKHLQKGIAQGLTRLQGSLLADQSWCRMQVGQHDAARRDALEAERFLEPEGTSDDRAPGFSRIAQVFKLLGDLAAAERNEKRAAEMWAGHERTQECILVALQEIVDANSRLR
jgi:hypothetical protein